MYEVHKIDSVLASRSLGNRNKLLFLQLTRLELSGICPGLQGLLIDKNVVIPCGTYVMNKFRFYIINNIHAKSPNRFFLK